MNETERLAAVLCPECGALVGKRVRKCWLCGHDQGTAVEQPDRGASFTISTITPPKSHPPQFGIASLMLMMTLISVCLGVGMMAPGLGIALAILVTPAFFRTAIRAVRRKVEGRPMDVGQKILFFGASMGVVTLIAVAAGVAFFVTCFAGFFGGMFLVKAAGTGGLDSLGWGLATGVGLGAVVGIFVGFLLIRQLWRQRD